MVNRDRTWELISEPFQLSTFQVYVNEGYSHLSIPSYTLQSLDFITKDYEVRQRIKEKWLGAVEKNPKLRPGLKFRFLDKPEVKHNRLLNRKDLFLNLGVTDYGVFVATNGAAKDDAAFATYLMDKGLIYYNDKFVYFASPIGNCAIVESSDGKIALIKRADDLYEYPGFYDTPGGHADPSKHSFDAKGQFDAIEKEVSEEIKIPKESIEEAYLIGIANNLENFRKPDLLFYLRSGLHSNKMDPNEEVSGLEKLSKDELFEHWKKRTYQIIPPSEALLFAFYSLQNLDLKAGYDLSFLENK